MNKRVEARRATQIIPTTGWYARFVTPEGYVHADGTPSEEAHVLAVHHQPVLCWALDVAGEVSGRVAFYDGCIGDPAASPDGFRGYVFSPDAAPVDGYVGQGEPDPDAWAVR